MLGKQFYLTFVSNVDDVASGLSSLSSHNKSCDPDEELQRLFEEEDNDDGEEEEEK